MPGRCCLAPWTGRSSSWTVSPPASLSAARRSGWCEANKIDYLFGLARNARLVEQIYVDLAWAEEEAARTGALAHRRTGAPARRFADFRWTTRDSWSKRRRVVAKAEWMPDRGEGGANPRFVVTSLAARDLDARMLYERVYCARGEMENRIEACQLDLFADRTSAATMKANQLRLWFASMAGACPRKSGGPARRAATDCARAHPTGESDVWVAAPEVAEDRRAGEGHRPAHPRRHGLGQSPCRGVRPRPRSIMPLIRAPELIPSTTPNPCRPEQRRSGDRGWHACAISVRQTWREQSCADRSCDRGEKCGLERLQDNPNRCGFRAAGDSSAV
jgi:hypothetical protein